MTSAGVMKGDVSAEKKMKICTVRHLKKGKC